MRAKASAAPRIRASSPFASCGLDAQPLAAANHRGETSIKSGYVVALSAAAGIVLGAAAVQALHAQAKPPGFIIAEIDVSNPEAYAKEFLPLASKALGTGGVKFLARGGRTMQIDGEPPKGRIAVGQYESIEKAYATYTSPAYKEARKIGDKYAKFRIYALEGVAQ